MGQRDRADHPILGREAHRAGELVVVGQQRLARDRDAPGFARRARGELDRAPSRVERVSSRRAAALQTPRLGSTPSVGGGEPSHAAEAIERGDLIGCRPGRIAKHRHGAHPPHGQIADQEGGARRGGEGDPVAEPEAVRLQSLAERPSGSVDLTHAPGAMRRGDQRLVAPPRGERGERGEQGIRTSGQGREVYFRGFAGSFITLTSSSRFDYDIAVAGGGPAGAAAATVLAQAGHSVLVLERERFPRFHIGESLIATVSECLETLGIAERVEAAGFPQKWGAMLSTHDGAAGRTVDFGASAEVRQPRTWQVERAVFDQMLLERAREVGAEVRESTRVEGCDFDADGATVRLLAGGESTAVRVRAVVDASGRSGLLARQLGLRRPEPRLANAAIYAHYSGIPRPGGERPTDIRLISRADAGWFWLIPIDARLTSVGVVLPLALYRGLERGSPEAMLERAIAETPVMAELLSQATREWPVRVENDLSYTASAYAGDRWLLVGDAASFLDPVFSTGVQIALESGIEAAQALDLAFAAGDFSARRFRRFERRQRERFRMFRKFVLAFYKPWFRDLFFQPAAPPALFRAVVTVLAGVWRPRWRTRFLLATFFFAVSMQHLLRFAPVLVRRDSDAGFGAAIPPPREGE